MFQWNNKNGVPCRILITYVDDFVYCGTLNWHKNVVETLLCIFTISKREKGSFRYIGLNVVQTGKEDFVDQNSYISSSNPVEINTEIALQKDEELTIEEKSKLRLISRQLLWLRSQTCPDASFDNCRVSNYGKNLMVKNLQETNKAVKKLQSSILVLVYPDLGNPEYLKVIVC